MCDCHGVGRRSGGLVAREGAVRSRGAPAKCGGSVANFRTSNTQKCPLAAGSLHVHVHVCSIQVVCRLFACGCLHANGLPPAMGPGLAVARVYVRCCVSWDPGPRQCNEAAVLGMWQVLACGSCFVVLSVNRLRGAVATRGGAALCRLRACVCWPRASSLLRVGCLDERVYSVSTCHLLDGIPLRSCVRPNVLWVRASSSCV